MREELFQYSKTVLRNMNSTSPIIGGVCDHAHILCSLPRVITIADLIKEMKTNTSRFVKSKGIRKFKWQTGYGVFSIGQSQVEQVIKHIETQPDHHKKISFQDELRKFFRIYEIEYDERYVRD
jgi:REP element-mobilizing transposase RayT